MPGKKIAHTHAGPMSGKEIRQAFLDFFAEHGHTVVPSSSLVPGTDQTLLFTNAGMVQFKDVFLGQDRRSYVRAASAQRCMRVSGKHNDLENVGPSPRHHTYFEMLGNFSFGDYFKGQAIRYAYDCLTAVYGLDPQRMYYTVHETDDEALGFWLEDVGVPASRVARMGDKTNFWQMADTGPCGPTSEIHYDFAPERGPIAQKDLAFHLDDNPDDRFLEIWNLVFMQFNQAADGTRTPLPAPGVDTGMGMERLAMIVQGVDNSYETDLFLPLMAKIQQLAGHDDAQRLERVISYRVIADHVRAATFLIADGVVPGNTGRNYVCRMVIRRASRFGNKAGFTQPFLASIAETVIHEYADVYPEIRRNGPAILRTLTEEEKRFQRTVDTGLAHLANMLDNLPVGAERLLPGDEAFDLYATYGLPLEITRDVARENQAEVDEQGFLEAMARHREASGAGQMLGELGGEAVDVYRQVLESLRQAGQLGAEGVVHDPHASLETEAPVLALIREGVPVDSALPGDLVTLVLPRTSFYIEAGGQVSDTGAILSATDPRWEVQVEDVFRPAAGVIAHAGRVIQGQPRVGDSSLAAVDASRRMDIMRNHTATHLLQASLRRVLGDHVRQAGSLVAPDRLRFDFTHPAAMTPEELDRVETQVNDAILDNASLQARIKPRDQAVAEGAMALFGETYGETVRTVTIGDDHPISYELCGGTHVPATGLIGAFLILTEGSVAAGVRRIEAVTGRAAATRIRAQLHAAKRMASLLGAPLDGLEPRVRALLEERDTLHKELARAEQKLARSTLANLEVRNLAGADVVAARIPARDAATLRSLADAFLEGHPMGVAVFGSDIDGRPLVVTAISPGLVPRGLHAGELARFIAAQMGGGGGGKPTLAQAGGKDPAALDRALDSAFEWITSHLRSG